MAHKRQRKPKQAAAPSPRRKIKPDKEIPAVPPLPSLKPARWFWILLIIAAAIRVFALGRHGLYMDEVLNLHDASRNLDHILLRTVHPLHFLMLRPFVSVSSSEFALRFMPMLMSMIGMIVFYWIGRLEKDERLAITLAGLWLSSQYIHFFSTDANYYAEMMTWSAIQVWGALILLNYGRLWGLAVVVAAGAANMLVHPFSGLFSAPLLGLILLTAIANISTRRNLVNSIRHSYSHRRFMFFTSSVIALGIVGYLAFRFGLRLIGQALSFLKQFQFASWAHNLDFNFYFFSSTFRAYGPSYISETAAAWISGAAVFALFLLGLTLLVRRKSPLAVIIIGSFLITFAMIFNTGITRFYHIRYTSYLVPLYLIGCGAGLVWLGGWVEQKAGARLRIGPFSPSAVTISAVMTLLFWPFTFYLIFGPFANWKTAQAIIEREFKPTTELYVFHKHDDIVARYYMERAGLNPNRVVFSNLHLNSLQYLALSDLKRSLNQNPNTWFSSHWTEMGTTNETLLQWVNDSFTQVLEAPSRNEISLIQHYKPRQRQLQRESAPHQTTRLFRWNYPNSFLLHPFDLEIPLSSAEQSNGNLILKNPVEDQGNGLVELTLRVDRTDTYSIELEGPAPIDGQGGIYLAGESEPHTLTPHEGRLRTDIQLHSGDTKLRITLNPVPPSEQMEQMTLRLYPSMAEPLSMHPFAYESIQPTTDLIVDANAGTPMLGLRRNGFIRYAFYAPDNGVYAITLNAANDKPGPVLWNVWMDDTAEAVLAFDSDDNTISGKTIVTQLTRGPHTVTLFFLNETTNDNAPADENRDGILQSIQVASSSLPPGSPDDRLALEEAVLQPPPEFVNGQAPIDANLLSNGWIVDLGDNSAFSVETVDGEPALTLSIAPKDHGGIVLAPPRPTNRAKYLLASVDIRCRNLQNHSANIVVVYFDTGGRPIGQRLIYSQGVSRNSQWVPFVALDIIPPQAAMAAYGVSVYENSRKPSMETGQLTLRKFRLHPLN